MQLTLVQGIMITIWAFIAGLDRHLEAFFIFRPIVVSTVAGIILGDPATGAMVGGITELAFAGLTFVGGTTPPDPLIAGLFGAIFAITGGVTPTAAVGLALPFCVVMQYILIFVSTAFVAWNKVASNMIEKLDINGLTRINVLGAVIVGAVQALFTFLAAYLLQDAITKLIDVIPEWLMHGLEVAGGVMPALGFGMLMLIMFKTRYLPYMIIGFLGACFIPFGNLLPVALIGTAMAMINFYNNKNNDKSGSAVVAEVENAGGDENVGI